MSHLILVRHGESVWNQDNLFTGWTDVDLTARGRSQAREAGSLLIAYGLRPDRCVTSYLKRAIRTLWIMLDELDMMWLSIETDWRLNERHYGALQGLNKGEMAERVGEEQVHTWRRSYDVRPPAMDVNDPRHPAFDPRYADVPREKLPATESLEDTLERVMPYWETRIVPQFREGANVLLCAHGNSLRALVKKLDGISDDAIADLEIPMGMPLIYRMDAKAQVEEKLSLTERAQ